MSYTNADNIVVPERSDHRIHPDLYESSQVTKYTPRMRDCHKCGPEANPAAGVDLGPGKWECAKCWKLRSHVRKARAQKL